MLKVIHLVKKFVAFMWNPKVHRRNHKSPPLQHWASWIHFTSYFSKDWVSIRGSGRVSFTLCYLVQTGCGAHPASHSVATGGSFSGGKAAGSWSWPLISA